MSEYLSPLGVIIRGPDRWASQGGEYHAARSTTATGRSRKHEGIDILTIPGQPILAPCAARFERLADPYSDKKDKVLSGCLLRTPEGFGIKILYFKPDPHLVGAHVRRGELLGFAQSLQHLYPGIQDHIHVELSLPTGERMDPTPYFSPYPAPATLPPVQTAGTQQTPSDAARGRTT